MARTPSTMKALGSPMPEFSLPDTVTGRAVSSAELSGRPLLVMFLCNHCPFVIHAREEIARLGRDYQKLLGIVAISSNDAAAYPQDGPAEMKKEAAAAGYVFPYLYDESQAVARAFDAACTPDFFLYGADHKLAYRGQLDDSRPGNGIPVSGNDLRAAIAAVASGKKPNAEQKPSLGCNIKWR